MISRSAVVVARAWCGFERKHFSKIGRRCIGYLRVRHAVLGPFETQAENDDPFLMFFRCELDHLHDDELDRRVHASWTSV